MVDWSGFYALRAQGDQQDLISKPGGTSLIQMAAGFPDPAIFPVQAFMQATQEAIAIAGTGALQYNAPGGYEPLRDWIAQHMYTQVRLSQEHVLLLHGSQQGLELVAKLLVDPGDWVVVEGPTFHGALGVFKGAGARIATVPMEPEGMAPDSLEAVIRELADQHSLPKFIYTIPTFHNPTGYTMNLERRLRLLEVAGTYGIPVVEDAPYNSLYYDATPPPPTLLELAGPQRVIHLGTFSKTLFPGARVGWMVADAAVIKKVWGWKHLADTCSSGIMQRVVHTLCTNGSLEANIAQAKALYRAKRDALLTGFENIPAGAVCSRPAGGFFAWLTLPLGVEAHVFQEAALDHGVAIAPGTMFFTNGQGANACRLTISLPAELEIRQGASLLVQTIHRLLNTIAR